MKLFFHSEAQAEARDAYLHYREIDVTLAEAFQAELRALLDSILKSPRRYPNYGRGHRRALLRRFPFTVFYQVEDDHILVNAVAHQCRRPDYWKAQR